MTWPDVLVLRYLQQSGQINSAIELTAREYVTTGYQTLLTYELPDGGFSWFGDAPAHAMLTAYGLMEFTDMAQVHPVDPALVARTQAWLAGQQAADGGWEPTLDRPLELASDLQGDRLRTTAFVTWSLAQSGYAGPAVTQGIAYLRAHAAEATGSFARALVVSALLAAAPGDAGALALATTLAGAGTADGDGTYWTDEAQGLMYGYGDTVALETTALVGWALLQAGGHGDLVSRALRYLLRAKDSFGNWGTTQATILTLRLMTAALLGSGGEEADATIEVRHQGVPVASVTVTPQTSDVHRAVDLKPWLAPGDNAVEITLVGSGSLAYQVVGLHYLPWSLVPASPEDVLGLTVTYDRTTLAVNEMVTATVTVRNNLSSGTVPMALVQLGVPPGFEVVTADLDTARQAGLISNWEVSGRRITAYLLALQPLQEVTFSYRLRATMPVQGSSEGFEAYAYYAPEIRVVKPPIAVTVTEP